MSDNKGKYTVMFGMMIESVRATSKEDAIVQCAKDIAFYRTLNPNVVVTVTKDKE